ncbi:isochorismatase family protein [Leucobacter komagatae]|uniref:Nicotinamidase n=1 Tax=Leucobacter komagatae TaxID=55969 RepID=A0A0D0H3Y0_9MICO|nr:isochorismatase family protein [Leucobacter komagatae]KIP51875.1 nicotinamidase [Leucobacter komagatae]
MAAHPESAPWLVIIDPQHIFASPESEWGSPFFAEAFVNMRRLAAAAAGRVLITRWLPTGDRDTAWGDYFAAWPFADREASDPAFDLVPGARELSDHPTLDLPTFGKWGAELKEATGGAAVVLAGVSTDCCVISTALAGADAGARITVAQDACAGSNGENHAAAIHVMSLYPPQLAIADTAACVEVLRAA